MKFVLLIMLVSTDMYYEAIWQHPDSGIGSYSNVYGNGWTKVCCDYPYYYPNRYHVKRQRHPNGEKK